MSKPANPILTQYFLDEPWRAALICSVDQPCLSLAVAAWCPLSPQVRMLPEVTEDIHRDCIALALVALSRVLPDIFAQTPELLGGIASITPLLHPNQRHTADSRLIVETKIFQAAYERIVDVEAMVENFQHIEAENARRQAIGQPLLPHSRSKAWLPTLEECLAILGEIFVEYEQLLKRKTQTIRRTSLVTPVIAAQLLANFLGKTIWAKSERMMPELGNRYPVWIRGQVVRVTTRGIVLATDNTDEAATLYRPSLSQTDRSKGTTLMLAPLQAVPSCCEFLHGIDTFPALPPEVEAATAAKTR